MSIRPLPQDVVDHIRSSSTITSLNEVVAKLIKNSLDAQATRINVSVDYSKGNCSVDDDGEGIAPAEFREQGGLLKANHTSRIVCEHEVHGRDGKFLASLAVLSLLSITSHHPGHQSHNTINAHGGKVISRHIPSTPNQYFETFSHGTRVVVRDLFGSMAVRVKQRVIMAEKAAVLDKEWGRLVRAIMGLLLAWPIDVSILLQDVAGSREIRLRTSGRAPTAESELSMCRRMSRLLAQSNLVDVPARESWVPVSASTSKLSVKGCICCVPVATKRAQFMSFGIQPIANELGSNVLYEEVNKVFANSQFALEEGDDRTNGDIEASEQARKERRSRRPIDRWPMFYFDIHFLDETYKRSTQTVDDLLDDRGRSLGSIINMLRAVCHEFLKKEGCNPRPLNVLPGAYSVATGRSRGATFVNSDEAAETMAILDSTGETPVPARHQISSLTQSSPFDQWHRVKTGEPKLAVSKGTVISAPTIQVADASSQEAMAPTAVSSTPGLAAGNARTTGRLSVGETATEQQLARETMAVTRLVGPSGKLLRRPFLDVDLKFNGTSKRGIDARLTRPTHEAEAGGQLLDETVTGRNSSGDEARSSKQGAENCSIRPAARIPGRENLETANIKTQMDRWIARAAAQNPVYERLEPAIPRTYDESRGGLSCLQTGPAGQTFKRPRSMAPFDTSLSELEGRVSKDALAAAGVVSQVDQKFILVKIPVVDGKASSNAATRTERRVLAIIDQHAADERCRLEELMRDYFIEDRGAGSITARTHLLEKPLQFETSLPETELLARYASHFRTWGISYTLELGSEADGVGGKSAKLQISSLPPSIIERCRQEPELLVSLMRKEVWRLDEHGTTGGTAGKGNTTEAHMGWISRFHGCPEGILELLNSRACRSAIMFNDILSQDECRDLVSRLAECAFPFQCAHGRPSMVPLLDLGDGMALEEEPGGNESLAERLKALEP